MTEKPSDLWHRGKRGKAKKEEEKWEEREDCVLCEEVPQIVRKVIKLVNA